MQLETRGNVEDLQAFILHEMESRRCVRAEYAHDLISHFEGITWATMEKRLLRDKHEK